MWIAFLKSVKKTGKMENIRTFKLPLAEPFWPSLTSSQSAPRLQSGVWPYPCSEGYVLLSHMSVTTGIRDVRSYFGITLTSAVLPGVVTVTRAGLDTYLAMFKTCDWLGVLGAVGYLCFKP